MKDFSIRSSQTFQKFVLKITGSIPGRLFGNATYLWNGNCGHDRKTGGKDGSGRVKTMKWALGVTKKDKIKYEYVRGTAKLQNWKTNFGAQGYVGMGSRREGGYVGKRIIEMEMPGKREKSQRKGGSIW